MRSITSIGVAVLLSVLLLLSGCSGGTAPGSVEPTPTPALDSKSTQISAEAKVVPIQSAELVFQTTGTVAEIMVQEGERVDKDAPLARLDARDLELRVEQAKVDLTRSRANYEQLKVTAENGRQAEISGIQNAEAQVREAQAALDQLLAGADKVQIAAARAEVAQAQANLDKLIGDQRAGQLEGARAGVQNAQARLNQLTAKSRKTDLDMAQAQVAAAEIALKQAELVLARTTLRAPFVGTVAALNLDIGEIPGAEKPAVVLADVSAWLVETSDLKEVDAVAVHEGDSVTITFDALPGVELAGRVQRVNPLGELYQGDMTYKVVVIPKQYDERLRWNMTATIAIAK